MALEQGSLIDSSSISSTSSITPGILKFIQNACAEARSFGLIIDNPLLSIDNILIAGKSESPSIALGKIVSIVNLNILISKYNELILAANNKDNSLVKPFVVSGDIIEHTLWRDIKNELIGDSANGIPAILFGVPSGGIFISGGTEVKESGYLKLYLNKQNEDETYSPVSGNPVTWTLSNSTVGTITGTTYTGSFRALEVTGDTSVTINASWTDPADQVTKTASHNVTVKETTIDSIIVELLNDEIYIYDRTSGDNNEVIFDFYGVTGISYDDFDITKVYIKLTETSEWELADESIYNRSGILGDWFSIILSQPVYGCKCQFIKTLTEINELETSLYYLVKAVPLTGDPYIIAPSSTPSTSVITGSGTAVVTSTTEYPGYEGYPVTEVNTINITRGEYGTLKVTFRKTGTADVIKSMKVWNTSEPARLDINGSLTNVDGVLGIYESKDGIINTVTFTAEIELQDGSIFTKNEDPHMVWSIDSDPTGLATIDQTGKFTAPEIQFDTTVRIKAVYTSETGVTQPNTLSFKIFNNAELTSITFKDNDSGNTSSFEMLENTNMQLYAFANFDDGGVREITTDTDATWDISYNPNGLTGVTVVDGLLHIENVVFDSPITVRCTYNGIQTDPNGNSLPRTQIITVRNISDIQLSDGVTVYPLTNNINEGSTIPLMANAVLSGGDLQNITNDCTYTILDQNGNPISPSLYRYPYCQFGAPGELIIGEFTDDYIVKVKVEYTTHSEILTFNLIDTNVLSSITITGGKSELIEDDFTIFTAVAMLDDLTTYIPQSGITWSISNYGGISSTYLSIDQTGKLSTGNLPLGTNSSTVTIRASFTRKGITKTATKTLTRVFDAFTGNEVLSSLSTGVIDGNPVYVQPSSTVNYVAFATFEENSTSIQKPVVGNNWTFVRKPSDSYSTISNGIVSLDNNIPLDYKIFIQCSYTYNSISKNSRESFFVSNYPNAHIDTDGCYAMNISPNLQYTLIDNLNATSNKPYGNIVSDAWTMYSTWLYIDHRFYENSYIHLEFYDNTGTQVLSPDVDVIITFDNGAYQFSHTCDIISYNSKNYVYIPPTEGIIMDGLNVNYFTKLQIGTVDAVCVKIEKTASIPYLKNVTITTGTIPQYTFGGEYFRFRTYKGDGYIVNDDGVWLWDHTHDGYFEVEMVSDIDPSYDVYPFITFTSQDSYNLGRIMGQYVFINGTLKRLIVTGLDSNDKPLSTYITYQNSTISGMTPQSFFAKGTIFGVLGKNLYRNGICLFPNNDRNITDYDGHTIVNFISNTPLDNPIIAKVRMSSPFKYELPIRLTDDVGFEGTTEIEPLFGRPS